MGTDPKPHVSHVQSICFHVVFMLGKARCNVIFFYSNYSIIYLKLLVFKLLKCYNFFCGRVVITFPIVL